MSTELQTVKNQIHEFAIGKRSHLRIKNPLFISGGMSLFNEKLRPNFTLGEWSVSILKRSSRLTIAQAPEIIVVAKTLDLLQNVRDHVRKTHPNFVVNIVSGYRSPGVDKMIGGSGTGPHTRGWAADVNFGGINNISTDHLRRAVSSVAFDFGAKGIELIIGGVNVHWDPVRPDYWITRQTVVNGRFSYPPINLTNDIQKFKLTGLK